MSIALFLTIPQLKVLVGFISGPIAHFSAMILMKNYSPVTPVIFAVCFWACSFVSLDAQMSKNPLAQSQNSEMGSQNDYQRKIYPLAHISAEDARSRLRALMPHDLSRQTSLLIDPNTNELLIQGPQTAIEMADRLLPNMQQITEGVSVGLLSPHNTVPIPVLRDKLRSERETQLQQNRPDTKNTQNPHYARLEQLEQGEYGVRQAGNGPQWGTKITQVGANREVSPTTNRAPIPTENSSQTSSPTSDVIQGDPNVAPISGRVYRCVVDNVVAFEEDLYQRYSEDSRINITFSENRENGLLNVAVFAPSDVQEQISLVLKNMGVLAPEQADFKGKERADFQVGFDSSPSPPSPPFNHTYVTKVISLEELDKWLQKIFVDRLIPVMPVDRGSTTNSKIMRYEFSVEKNQRRKMCQLEFDFESKRVFIQGEKTLCEQMLQLIEMIDRPNPPEGIRRKIFPLKTNNNDVVGDILHSVSTAVAPKNSRFAQQQQFQSPQQQMVQQRGINQPFREQQGFDSPSSFAQHDASTNHIQQRNSQQGNRYNTVNPANNQASNTANGQSFNAANGQSAQNVFNQTTNQTASPNSVSAPTWKSNPVRQVAYKMQDFSEGLGTDIGNSGGLGGFGGDTGFGDGGQFGPGPFGEGGFGPGMNRRGGTFDDPQGLNVQVLPDLDIIIFEGTGAELKRLEKMMSDIETLMQESQSEFKTIYLQNVDCFALNEMIADLVFNDKSLLATKQGRFQLFPLRNPNAVLVVGWGTQFEKIIDLIDALDQPIAEPGSRWKAFTLKYVSVTYAQTLLTGMFPTPPAISRIPGQGSQLGWAWLPRVRVVSDMRTNTLLVEAAPNDLREVEKLLRSLDIYKSGPQVVVKPFKLKFSLASDLAPMLSSILTPGATGIGVASDAKLPEFLVETVDSESRKMIESGILSDVKITPDVRNNSIVITAPEYAIDLIGYLIDMLDRPSPVAEVKVFPIFNGDAGSILMTLTSLIPATLAGQAGPQLLGASGADQFVPVRLTTDKRTNSILAAGGKEDLKVIGALIERLDSDDAEKRIRKVQQLKYAQAEDVAKAISQYTDAKTTLLSQAPDSMSPYLQMEEAFIVIPDKSTNSLIIECTPKYLLNVEDLIKDLDRAPDQVVIQVLIAEITSSNTDELGAEFGLQDSILFNRSTFDKSVMGTKTTTLPDGTVIQQSNYTPAGDGKPGFLFNENPKNSLGNNLNALSAPASVAPQLLTNFGTGRVSDQNGFGGLVLSASSDSVSILIRALQETKRLEVLSRPQIMAMDNQMAFILVGQRVPRVSGGSAAYGAAVSNVVMEEVGLLLMVTPQISPEGKVVMMIGAEKSSLGSLADGIPIPTGDGGSVNSPKINAITASTRVSAGDNQTVMLGGLLTQQTEKVDRKVPFLGDIPVLGKLFRYSYSNKQRTELLIILTPRIVKDAQDAERIKREEAARLSWCLRDVARMHGSPNSDIGIWDATANQPVTGGIKPVYPAPALIQDLAPMPDSIPEPPTRSSLSPAPAPLLEENRW
ncbi:MAG: secretin N-terminal domain-containing protein [Thermoguttaceae bacterium]